MQVHCEWGVQGLVAQSSGTDVVIIVDILSFSTCVYIGVSRQAQVLPIPWDSRAHELAAAAGAELAGTRGTARYSLSPGSFLSVEPGNRIALPSPNGAALSLRAGSITVLAGCLRNSTAVAQAAQRLGKRVLILPAGEQWPDASLRPCLEDWLGAGAIVDGLSEHLSAEAETARGAFQAARAELPRLLRSCVSGRELIEKGFAQDIDLAAELDVSDAVPILRGGMYQNLPSLC